MIAKVFVDKTVYSIDKAFDYIVPPPLCESIKRGCRVLVPFGNSNKKLQGLVEQLSEISEYDGHIKPILSQLDDEPIVTEEMFSIIEFL